MNTDHDSDRGSAISRREAIHRGLCGAGGALLAGRIGSPRQGFADRTEQAQPKPPKQAKARSVIQIFLWGGMSHNDTWDPKPQAGRDYVGELRKTLDTNVDGIQLSELFPELAKQADKYSLIRSMTHGINAHETAAYLMQTGHSRDEELAYPSVGTVFSLMKGPKYQGLLPPYIVLTKAQGRFPQEGFLGSLYKPFSTGGNPNAKEFAVEGIVARDITDDRQKARRELLGELNTMGRVMAGQAELTAAEEGRERAYELILGPERDVFNLDKEKSELRDRYGRHTFGQECLAARRLAEAGVPYIMINYPGGWDTHKNHFTTMRQQAPQLDQGLATLLYDLHDHGLLESTLVWCCGEFGRTPKINWKAPWNGGRHHYGKVFSVLVAGGGFKGGQIVGSSDEKGMEVKDRPVYPVDLLGSIYWLAGIDHRAKLPHPMGLEAHVLPTAAEGAKSAGPLTEIM